MPVIFKCECGQYLSVTNKYIKKKLQCPSCEMILLVPSPTEPGSEKQDKIQENLNNDSTLLRRCHHCGAKITDSQQKECPLCNQEL